MQRGSCFINYEDFNECFTTYKEETKSSYSIQSSVSVHHHNIKFGTDIRPDVTFTEVKFCCSKLQGHNGKRKPQDVVCPAYFFLQYDMDLDRLVVKEECTTHIHSETNPPQGSLVHPPETGDHQSPDLEVPSKKICNQSLSSSPVRETDQEDVQPDVQSPCKLQRNLSLDIDEDQNASKASSPEGSSTEAFSRLDNFIKDFQKKDAGLKLSLTTGGENQLEQTGFQTSSMSSWFVKFPESLLLHRVSSKHGYVLYAFLVETKERMGKVVHFSFVKEDNAKNISKMLEMLKHFNSEWPKVKVISTDVSFGQVDVLKEAFPSVQVLLSVYHTARLIERKIKGSTDFKFWVRKWVDEAIYQTSPQKLNFLAEKLEQKLDQDLYAKLCKDWFSNELVWYMHVKKGEHSCRTYMDSVGLIDETISNFLAKQSSMENAIQEFLIAADCFTGSGLEKQKDGFLGFSKNVCRAKPKGNANKLRPLLPAREAPPSASEVSTDSTKEKAIVQSNQKTILNDGCIPGPKLTFWRPITLANKMLLSLNEYCTDVGFRMCSREWEVVQRSTHLISEQPDFTAVQILEETHNVSLNGHSCTCYFNTKFRLPCRHIMSMLYVYKKPVEESMVSMRWRKTYVKPISNCRVYGKVLHHTKSKAETKERLDMIKSLTKEFHNLLMQCDGPEMQVRISTLQMIVDMWHNDSSVKKPHPMQNKVPELPYRWVKKEPMEGENGFELCRLDPKSHLS